MQNNLKIKRAVAIALGLFTLGLQQQALALGLGDINVQSHLGQPLRAKIKVHGASDLKSDDLNNQACFKLVNSDESLNALPKMNFKLGAVSGDEAMLTVTSAQVISEPILNIAIIAECGSTIRRDYVVLLDPLLTTESESTAGEEVSNIAEESVTTAKKTTQAGGQLAGTSAKSTKKKHRHGKQSSKTKALSTSEDTNIVLHVPGGNTQEQISATEKNSTNPSKPRLSISNGEHANVPLDSSNLRLDRQLSFTPDANYQAPAEDADIQDEVTAMNNRLAHLTAQVAKLQSRNLALESDNKLKSLQIAETQSSKDNLRWLGYALGAALLLISGQLATKWWRRRQYEKLIASSDAVLASLNNSNFQDDELDLGLDGDNSLNIKSRQNTNNPDDKSSSDQLMFEPAQTIEDPIVIDEESYDLSILDHADVFLSHGRTSLAIQLLQNHLLDHPKQSITIWLFLLDLLAKENLKAVYEQTALECKEHFNVKISEFATGNKSANQNLESFPHLTEGLQQVWGTPASVVFLDDLIYNNRLEPRNGLDKGLIEELILLKGIAQENANSAEVIQLDEKKIALLEQKEALMAAKKAEKLNQLAEAERLESEKAEALAKSEKIETKFDFNLVEWK